MSLGDGKYKSSLLSSSLLSSKPLSTGLKSSLLSGGLLGSTLSQQKEKKKEKSELKLKSETSLGSPLLQTSLLGSTGSSFGKKGQDNKLVSSQNETSNLQKTASLLGTTSLKLTLSSSLKQPGASEPSHLVSRGTSSLLISSQKPSSFQSSLRTSGISHRSSLGTTTGLLSSHTGSLTGGSTNFQVTKYSSLTSSLGVTDKPGKTVSNKIAKELSEHDLVLSQYSVAAPSYSFTYGREKTAALEIPDFLPPEKDVNMYKLDITTPLHDINGRKLGLINAVSSSLICQPNFKDPNDLARNVLTSMAQRVVSYDPEFILKVALYSRKELNIRTTSNFLLALAANVHPCRPFIKKYFKISINLPSDWIEVAEIYQAFGDKSLNFGSLPSALRRAMITKFPDFDKYQLAKYNKDKTKKKKKRTENKDVAADTGVRGRGRGSSIRSRGAVRGRGSLRGRGGVTSSRVQRTTKKRSLYDSDSSSDSDSDSDSDDENQAVKRQISGVEYDESDTEEERALKTFTLKQLIRKLHITEPVEHVMSLIGKKYPRTLEEFYACRLPGTWEEERAGKRMKLPVPETWETQVSLKGNKAATWEELIDHKKLPFMAMLRNLRNLVKAGISQKHHNFVIRKLKDERSVIMSKQFPFRFFSAYEVLGTLEKEYEENQQNIINKAVEKEAETGITPSYRERGSREVNTGRGRGRGRGRGGREKMTSENWWLLKKNKKEALKEVPYDKQIIERYRKALDTSVKIATVYNVQPIRGRTIILCDITAEMDIPCTSAKGLGKPRTMKEVSVLLGLMCKYSCEECDMVVFNETSYRSVELDRNTILDNMQAVLSVPLTQTSTQLEQGLPSQILWNALRDRIEVDNLIVLSKGISPRSAKGRVLSKFLTKYRRLVNANLLYVSVSFAGRNCGHPCCVLTALSKVMVAQCAKAYSRSMVHMPSTAANPAYARFDPNIQPEHSNDIYISGYSDQILRFIAEKGDSGQLTHVEHLDQKYNLKSNPISGLDRGTKVLVKPEAPLPVLTQIPRWRTAKVFISSTFRDMHGERDLLTRFVFPELRARCKQHFINVYEVDLRWGITEAEAKSNKTLELCLSEISKSQFFIGILGSRYGWVPEAASFPDSPDFDWLRDVSSGLSVTEIEMQYAALCASDEERKKAFFYLRDPSFESNIPKDVEQDFLPDNEENEQKLQNLKSTIRTSGFEVYDGYPCRWGGVVDNKPIVSGLEDFGARVVNNLWGAIRAHYPYDDAIIDEDTHVLKQQQAFVENRRSEFIGRNNLLKQCAKKISEIGSGVLMLTGKSGCGKTSLMTSLVQFYSESKDCQSTSTITVHIVGATPGSTNIAASLARLCKEISRTFGLKFTVPEDFKNLSIKFGELLKEAASMCGSPMVIFIDGIDLMEETHQPHNMEWLPCPIPKNVVFVMTVLEGDRCHKSLKRISGNVQEIQLGLLDMWDKAEFVRQSLARHRKALDESPFNNQLKLLLSKKEAANPLFLQLACEELRVFGIFEKIGGRLKEISHTVPALVQEILVRLETDLGKKLVAKALSLLVCSRDGLEASELHDLLSIHSLIGDVKYTVQDVINIKLCPGDKIPDNKFALLKRALQGFMNPTGTWSSHLCLAHADITNAVRSRYIKVSSDEEKLQHTLLAGYFYQAADPDRNKSWKGQNYRAFSELAYHLTYAGCFKVLQDVLCNLDFIHSTCQIGLGSNLVEDFVRKVPGSKSGEREHARFFNQQRVQDYFNYITRNVQIIQSHPALTWQQAINEPKASDPAIDARKMQKSTFSNYMLWASKPTGADPCYTNITDLSQPVTCVAVQPGGRYFVTGSDDCVVKLYDMASVKEVRSYLGHSDRITDVCFVGTDRICSASMDNTLSIWHVNDGHRISLLKGHGRRVNSCASDSSGKFIASASWDCYIKIWISSDGKVDGELDCASPVNCVAFHPEGQLIVSGSWDSLIRIWDIFHRKRIAVLRGHHSSVRAVAYSPSGRHIASASLDGEVKLWFASNGSQVGNITGHALPINKLTFSPTGKELITVSDDHKIKVWSGHLGVPLQSIGDESYGAAVSVALSPDGETVAVGYHEGQLRAFDVLTGGIVFEVAHHTASVRCVAYTPNDEYIVSGSDDTNLTLMSCQDGSSLGQMSHHDKPVVCLTIGRLFMATGGEDFACNLFAMPIFDNMEHVAHLTGQIAPITACTFNKDETRLAVASRDSSVWIWDTLGVSLDPQNAKPIKVLNNCHSDWINGCVWSNLGDFLVTCSNDFNLKIWDVDKGVEKVKMTGHMSAVNSVSYKYGCIISSCSDATVKVWSHKGTEITTLYGHTERVNACDMYVKAETEQSASPFDIDDWSVAVMVAESEEANKKKKSKGPDVKMENVLVVTCSDDGSVRLWKPLQANELSCMLGHSDRVISIASDKSSNLVSSSLDRSIRLWKPNLEDKSITESHNAEITFTKCHSKKPLMVSGSRDGILKVWSSDTDISSDVLPTCEFSIQAHEKSVNDACFLGKNAELFVTVSDDTTIQIWQLFWRNDRNSIRKYRKYTTDSPVTSTAWNEHAHGKSGHVFFTAEWNCKIKVFNSDKNGAIYTVVTRMTPPNSHNDWILNLNACSGSVGILTSTAVDGKIAFWDISGVYGNRPVAPQFVSQIDIPSEKINEGVEPAKRETVWGLCVAFDGDRVVSGDSHGQLTVYKSKDLFIKSGSGKEQIISSDRVHKMAITCIKYISGKYITASLDGTIKVWSKNLKQVGLFFCPGPITSLCCYGEETTHTIYLMAGGQRGNINFFTWNS